MKRRNILLAVVFAVFYLPAVFAGSITGNWVTTDEQTGKKRAVIHLVESKGILSGTVKKVYPKPGDTGICLKCPAKFKGKPVKGLQIIWGFKSKGDGVWEDGKILDPKAGKVYHAKMTLKGNKLYVRGYVGFPLLGRTQVWVREG